MTDRDPDDDSRGFRIVLPPIRLPPLFPHDLRIASPVHERVRGSRNALLAAIALDLLDAIAVVTVGGGLVRVALGTLLAAVLLGPLGLAYAWEAVAVAALPRIAVVPTATLLYLVDARRS